MVDLVSANAYDNTLTVLLSEGNRWFAPGAIADTGNTPWSLAVADVNGDGKPDLICANMSDGTVSVLTNSGQLVLSQPVCARTSGFRALVRGDLGATYTIQASEDGINWAPLQKVSMTNSACPFTDPYADSPCRLYRAVSP
jgi:hypothetical protein